VDDVTPLRTLTPEVVQKDVASSPPVPPRSFLSANEFVFGDDSQFDGQNPPEAATITYYLKKRHLVGDLKLEIYDEKGTLVSTLPGGNAAHQPRLLADARPGAEDAEGGPTSSTGASRVAAAEGTYTVKMIKGKDTFESKVSLVADPRSRATAEDRRLQRETVARLHGLLGDMTYTVERIADLRDQARVRAGKLPAGDALRKRIEVFADALEAQRAALVSTKESEGGSAGTRSCARSWGRSTAT